MKRLLLFLILVLSPLFLTAGTTDFLTPGVGGTIAGDVVYSGTLDIDADGVRLDSDNDGMLIITGLGNGSDEDLRLNLDDTSNVGTFTSTTSLATLNFSSIALQESGIAVLNNDEIDASSELLAIMDDETGTGLLVFATLPTFTTGIIVTSTDPADAGEIRLNNAATVAWEAAPAGTDETLSLSSDENFQLSGPLEVDASDPADSGAVRLDNNESIAWESAPAGTDITLLVDASEILQASGAFNALTLTEGTIAVLNNDEMDASSELLAIIDDETGSGLIVFGTSPTITTAVITVSTTASITASTTQTQGQGALTTNVNEVSVCVNANDTVTAPAAAAGYVLTIINNGAETLQVFPASGDNLGAGVDTAITMVSGQNRVWTAFDTTNWEQTGGSL